MELIGYICLLLITAMLLGSGVIYITFVVKNKVEQWLQRKKANKPRVFKYYTLEEENY